MLRFLTHKLRTHSLNEANHPFQSKIDDDRDSGTESDDENADVDELRESMERSELSSGSSGGGGFVLGTAAVAATEQRLQQRRCGSSFEDDDDEEIMVGKGACESPGLDSALPSDTDHNVDQHSSEEELEVINGAREGGVSYPEKRKWSQANRLSFGDSSGSSDEEVRDLMFTSAPVEFRSSPPADAHKPSHSQSPPAKLFHFSSSTTNFTSFEVCSVSPRKRHRQSHSRSTPVQRPCLDFEKMQQLRTRAVTTWRPSREVSLKC